MSDIAHKFYKVNTFLKVRWSFIESLMPVPLKMLIHKEIKTLPQNINLYTASFIKKVLLQKMSAEFNSVHNDIVGFYL